MSFVLKSIGFEQIVVKWYAIVSEQSPGEVYRNGCASSSLLLFLLAQSAKLQKKLHQLEEQLNNEMQTKDELEHKCR